MSLNLLVVISSVAAVLVLVLVISRSLRHTPTGRQDPLRVFCLPREQWTVIGGDIGSIAKPIHLHGQQSAGTPDALFEHVDGHALLIGELKSRRYRGQVRWREFFQVQHYALLARRRWRGKRILVRIRYADCWVDIEPSPKVGASLEAMADEALSARHKGKLINEQPLQLRLPELAANDSPPVHRCGQ